MRAKTKISLLSIIVLWLISINTILAQGESEVKSILDGIPSVVEWFDLLNNKFDEIIESEKRDQLLRSVDRFKKNLYILEVDKRSFIESLPAAKPDNTELQIIKINLNDLRETLKNLREDIKDIGSDLREYDGISGNEVEASISNSLSERNKGLDLAEVKLLNNEEWDPAPVIERSKRAIEMIKESQILVTKFYNRLKEIE